MADLSLVGFFCYKVNDYVLNDTYICFQIAPFDIEFSVTHKELDFSHLLVSSLTLRSTLYGRCKPFFIAFERCLSLVQIIDRFLPSVFFFANFLR